MLVRDQICCNVILTWYTASKIKHFANYECNNKVVFSSAKFIFEHPVVKFSAQILEQDWRKVLTNFCGIFVIRGCPIYWTF